MEGLDKILQAPMKPIRAFLSPVRGKAPEGLQN